MTTLPRPSLAWLSAQAIGDVRNKLLGLFLEPNQWVKAPAPKNKQNCYWLAFTGGMIPQFYYEADHEGKFGVRHTAWLKIPARGKPHFDLQIADGEITPVPFHDPRLIVVVRFLRHLHRFFPYWPTDNYVEKGGDFVA